MKNKLLLLTLSLAFVIVICGTAAAADFESSDTNAADTGNNNFQATASEGDPVQSEPNLATDPDGTPIWPESYYQAYGYVYENQVIFYAMEDQSDSSTLGLYVKDLGTGTIDFVYPDTAHILMFPKIGKDGTNAWYVWQGNNPSNQDETNVYFMKKGGSASPVSVVTSNKGWPSIYGKIVVWMDDRNGNWDIYMRNLSTGTVSSVTGNSADQVLPAIYGNIVVWTDMRNGNADIYMKNISTGAWGPVTTNPAVQDYSAIYGNIVVWTDNQNGNWDIYMKDLNTGIISPVCTDPGDQVLPAIYQNIVVWTDSRNGEDNLDIYMKDLSTGIISPLCTATGNQVLPSVYGDIVVWTDQRNGEDTSLVYITTLPDNTPPTASASPKGGVYYTAKTVTLTMSEAGTIYYTTDGTDPSNTSPVYTTPLNIATTTTLKFMAVDEAHNQSPIYTEVYTIDTTSPAVTISDLAAAATTVKAYYESHSNTLPATVVVGAHTVTMPQFLYLLATATVNINNGVLTPINVVAVNSATSPSGSYTPGNLYKSAYVSTATSIKNFINTNGRVPNYATTSLGKIPFSRLVYMYSKILNYYRTNARLPNYVGI